MIFSIKKRFNRLRELNPGSALVRIGLFLVVCTILFTVFFKWAEGTSWGEAAWQSWQTITTVGYGNQPAESLFGRISSVIFGTVGIASLGVLFSATLDYKIYRRNKWRHGLINNPIEEGYVIFNYPGEFKLLKFIQEIRTVEDRVGICVVDNSIEKLPQSIASLNGIHFIKGSILSKDTYTKAGISDNKAVIIFPMQSSNQESDAATKTTVDLVEKFITTETRIMHVLVDPSNAWMFEGSSSTQILESFEVLTLVQECQDQYSADTVEDLLLNSKGGNLKTFKPKLVVGYTWKEFISALSEVCSEANIPCNPLALIKDGKSNTCPEFTARIEEGDSISMITYNSFDWDRCEKNMKQYLTQSK